MPGKGGSGRGPPSNSAITAVNSHAGCSNDEDQLLDVPALVRLCCESFDEHGETNSELANCVFMVGEWLVDGAELMAQFVALYQEEKERYGIRVCAAVSFWIRRFPIHFDANPSLCSLVHRLKSMAARDRIVDDSLLVELDLSSVPSYAWLRNVSVRNPVGRHLSLSFEQWSPEDLATALTYIDYRVLSRVTIPEIKRYVKLSKLQHTPILERSIAVFNSISCWVQCMILSKSSAGERADVITKFINVGKHLHKLYNFNTLMAVIGGVTHSSIARLTKTQSLIPQQVKKDLAILTQLLSTSNNFANYRKALKEAKVCYKMPIMGIHLKDMIAWHGVGAAEDFDKTGRIRRKRLMQLESLLSDFIGVNRFNFFADPNMDLVNTLKVSFDISYNENDIYDLSTKREPKTLLNSGVTSKQPAVFADWASGVCQAPDRETVNKHIAAMVDAVFKHYDHDRDAYISRAEFEQIAGNFPFLDSFVTIDADRDGQISKSEMKEYFLELNKQSAEFRSGFHHNFHETTFLTPSICAHCKKMLWGLIRQGLKCRDCSLIVHDACKSSAIAECRRHNNAAGRPRRKLQSDAIPIVKNGADSSSVTLGSLESARNEGASGHHPSSGGHVSMGTFYEWLTNGGNQQQRNQRLTIHHGGSSGSGVSGSGSNGVTNGSLRRIRPHPPAAAIGGESTLTTLTTADDEADAAASTSVAARIKTRTASSPSPTTAPIVAPSSLPTEPPATNLNVAHANGSDEAVGGGASSATLSLLGARGMFRSSFHRLIRSSKKTRSASEPESPPINCSKKTTMTPDSDPHRSNHRPPCPSDSPPPCCLASSNRRCGAATTVAATRTVSTDDDRTLLPHQCSLASEEVFCEEDPECKCCCCCCCPLAEIECKQTIVKPPG